MYELLYTDEAIAQIHKHSLKIQRQLKSGVLRIAQNPTIGKKLTHQLSDYWSYRSGDYRIIYQIRHKEITVLIVTVGARKNIYENLTRKRP